MNEPRESLLPREGDGKNAPLVVPLSDVMQK